MRWFVQQSIKRGRVCAFKQYYQSKIRDDFSKTRSEELNVKGKIYYIIKAYLEYKNKHLKIFEKEQKSKLSDNRKENVDEEENFINEKLSKLPIHQLIKQKKIR